MRAAKKNTAEKIFDNILFLSEVFGDRADDDIPKLPVLEMAQCFDLDTTPRVARADRRRKKSWPLWR